jgi:allophanate hydrolase subunit 2
MKNFSGFVIDAGSTLTFERIQGWFGYLAISGGLEGNRILGSLSAYPAAKIGERLRKGEQLREGRNELASPVEFLKPELILSENESVEILPAIHTSLFEEASKKKINDQEYLISSQSNRMGIRLSAEGINAPTVSRSVPSLSGTIQITRGGDAIILGPDGPTTGGYAQIAILSRTSWTAVACSPPGRSIRFQWITKEAAKKRWEERNHIFQMKELWKPIS